MTEETIIDGELSCNNCLEKTRCKQQQEVKAQRIDAILSYIANEDNEKYIVELKNEIPAITRCDVVLEKQLKHLEQENKDLKNKIEDKPSQCIFYNYKQNKCALFTKTVAYHCVLKEIREIVEFAIEEVLTVGQKNATDIILKKIDEVLKQ